MTVTRPGPGMAAAPGGTPVVPAGRPMAGQGTLTPVVAPRDPPRHRRQRLPRREPVRGTGTAGHVVVATCAPLPGTHGRRMAADRRPASGEVASAVGRSRPTVVLDTCLAGVRPGDDGRGRGKGGRGRRTERGGGRSMGRATRCPSAPGSTTTGPRPRTRPPPTAPRRAPPGPRPACRCPGPSSRVPRRSSATAGRRGSRSCTRWPQAAVNGGVLFTDDTRCPVRRADPASALPGLALSDRAGGVPGGRRRRRRPVRTRRPRRPPGRPGPAAARGEAGGPGRSRGAGGPAGPRSYPTGPSRHVARDRWVHRVAGLRSRTPAADRGHG